MKTYHDAKILIVDDQDANVRLLERILKQAGYTGYRSLTDSRQVLAAYQEFQPDIVLLDLMMPHLDGLGVLEQLRPLSKDSYMPILVLTADVTPEARRRALNAGAKDFLTKPLDAVEVLLRIKNLLETRFLYQQFKQRADQLSQAQQLEAVRLLAGSVANSFNDDLALIIGSGEKALAEVGQTEPARALIQDVCAAAVRAAGLTHQLLAFSRNEVSTLPGLDINTLVGDIGTSPALKTM
jgi:DNA-binding response OmpR family regulator